MKILISGGHFTPAQAVIEQLQKQKGIDIVYVGRKNAVEAQVLPKLGVKFYPIVAGKLSRYLSVKTILDLVKIPVGFVQSFWLLMKEKPDVVLSFGGYVAVPIVISAWLLSIPVIVHEQTLVSGLANRISNYFASKIAVSYDQDYKFKKEKIVLTGNPIRKEIIEPSGKFSKDFEILTKNKKRPVVLVTGGNQGSHIINETVEKIVKELTNQVILVHQTGDSSYKDYERLVELKANLENSENYIVEKWIDSDDMGSLLDKADLVVSRSGANTLLELAYKGVPTILVPIPFLYANEQVKNSKFYQKLGLAKIIYQSDLSSERLLTEINESLKNIDKYKKQAQEAKQVAIPDAAKRLALETMLLAQHD